MNRLLNCKKSTYSKNIISELLVRCALFTVTLSYHTHESVKNPMAVITSTLM